MRMIRQKKNKKGTRIALFSFSKILTAVTTKVGQVHDETYVEKLCACGLEPSKRGKRLRYGPSLSVVVRCCTEACPFWPE